MANIQYNGDWYYNGRAIPTANDNGYLIGEAVDPNKPGYGPWSPDNPRTKNIHGQIYQEVYHPEPVDDPNLPNAQRWLPIGWQPSGMDWEQESSGSVPGIPSYVNNGVTVQGAGSIPSGASTSSTSGGTGFSQSGGNYTGEDADLFSNLDESFERRLAIATQYRDADRAAGAARGQEVFAEGSLGRVSEELDPEFLKLLEARTQLSEGRDLSEAIGLQRLENQRAIDEYDALIKARDPNSPEQIAARENAVINLQRALQGNLKQARGAGTQGGYAGGAQQAGLEQEAARNYGLARGNLERDLLLANQSSKEMLVREAANTRAANINQLANLQIGEAAMQDTLSSRSEAIVMAAQDERLRRQLINLENMRSEKYGAVGLEEAAIQQGVTERGGIRQELIAEAGQAESARHAREMEEIQRIEAEKPPPSGGGGGKSVMCVVMWKLGLISDEVLKGDIEYCKRYIDDDTRRGYFWFSTPVAEECLRQGKDGWLTKAMAPFVVNWAEEMAAREGLENAKGNFLGKLLCSLGVPVCKAAGVLLRWLGHTEIADENARAILDTAKHVHADILGELSDEEKAMASRLDINIDEQKLEFSKAVKKWQ